MWLAKVAEKGMCRPSCAPARDPATAGLTRYRVDVTRDRTRYQQRMEKLLEDAQIKVSSVVSKLHGVTGRRSGRP